MTERKILRVGLAALVAVAACGSDHALPGPDAGICTPPKDSTAPTYTQLYTTYFAPGTPGHCANAGCHNGPDFNVWMCGPTKDTCYNGMLSVEAGLINPANPAASPIGDPKSSPLSWINPNGNMPFDMPMMFPQGRDAILAWVAACAQNN